MFCYFSPSYPLKDYFQNNLSIQCVRLSKAESTGNILRPLGKNSRSRKQRAQIQKQFSVTFSFDTQRCLSYAFTRYRDVFLLPRLIPPTGKGLALWSPTGKPVASLSFADSLRERRDLVVRHPDHKRSGLKPWLSAVGVNRCLHNKVRAYLKLH